MRLNEAAVLVRVRSVGEVVDVGTLFWVERMFAPLARIVASALPLQVLCAVACCVWRGDATVGIVAIVTALLVSSVVDQTAVISVGDGMFGSAPTLRAATDRFAARAGSFFGFRAATIFVTACYSVLFFSIVLAPIVLLFAKECFWLERASASGAISRAHSLAFRHVGTMIGLAVSVLAIRLGVVLAGCAAVYGALAFVGGDPAYVWHVVRQNPYSAGVVALMLWTIAAPWAACVRLCGYLNVRTVVEGWDAQLRVLQLGTADRTELGRALGTQIGARPSPGAR